MKKWALIFVLVLSGHFVLATYVIPKPVEDEQPATLIQAPTPFITSTTDIADVKVHATTSSLNKEVAIKAAVLHSSQDEKNTTKLAASSHLVTQTVYSNIIQKTPPVYPKLAKENNHQGSVSLKFLVDKQGTVKDIFIFQSSGYKELDESAKASLAQWRFTPTLINGQKVNYWYQQSIHFDIEKEYKYTPYVTKP